MYKFMHHEDDVGMVQILPIEWWAYCVRELGALAEHSDRHFDPGSGSWDAMYTLSAPAASLPNLQLTESQFIELLDPHGEKFDEVTSTLGEIDAQLGIRAVGFGPARNSGEPWGNSGIIADLDGEKVTSIWCRLHGHDADERKALAAMLVAVSRDRHMLLIDWRKGLLVDLRSRDEIDAYLE